MTPVLHQKILELFQYRKFSELMTLGGMTSMEQEEFQAQLVLLQASIYYLDHHLETNWEVDHRTIEKCWQNIYSSMEPFGLTHNEKFELNAHIRKYQKHELELRQFMFPTRFKKEFFYFYKSCDVKLLRALIYRRCPKLRSLATAGDWRYFDLVTEVNDDVEDVFEDCTTINGNCYLLSMMLKGHDQTVNDFITFLNEIQASSEARFTNSSNPLTRLIARQTLSEITTTKEMTIKHAKKMDSVHPQDILIHAYIKPFTIQSRIA